MLVGHVNCELYVVMASGSLTDVSIDRPRRHTQGPELAVHRTPKVSTKSSPDLYGQEMAHYRSQKVTGSSDFVYVNNAYVGSLDSVNENRLNAPPTSVIREQYWACSRWPYMQRVLAIAVGILFGAVIGLVMTVALKNNDQDLIPGFLTRSPAPD